MSCNTSIDQILQQIATYEEMCAQKLIKRARIRKLPSGKYRVLSEKGKNLGTSNTKEEAIKRLQQVEYFKHQDENKAEDQIIDLTQASDFSLSALMRELRKQGSKEVAREFLKLYKKYFDKAVKDKLQKPEKIALQKTVVKFDKLYKIKIDKKMIKKAAVIGELGDPVLVGKYLADIIRFTLNRISPERRGKAIESLRHKFYSMNANEIASKNLPPSSAIGQSITFVKHVLFNHDPNYIREVLNNLVRHL